MHPPGDGGQRGLNPTMAARRAGSDGGVRSAVVAGHRMLQNPLVGRSARVCAAMLGVLSGACARPLPAAAPPSAVVRAAIDGPRLRVSACAGAECSRYELSLDDVTARGWRRATGPHGRVLSNRTWLRLPPTAVGETEIRLDLPEGTRAVVPWRDAGDGVWRAEASLRLWEGYLMLTTRPPVRVSTAMADFEVGALHVGTLRPEAWLRAASDAVWPLAGELPLGRVQVILDGRAVPADAPPGFGLSSRGGGRSLLFVVGRDADALVGEWIAVHEMVHLVLPVTRDEDAWLGEGIATYYQEVLRARAGMISAEQAWENLGLGFEAGARAAGARTLEEVARGRGDYTRLYWSGAALALRMDVALRRRGSSLDAVVQAWRRCCADDARTWSAMELLARADAPLGEAVLVPEARAALSSRALPDVSEVFAAQGDLRASITARRPAARPAP